MKFSVEKDTRGVSGQAPIQSNMCDLVEYSMNCLEKTPLCFLPMGNEPPNVPRGEGGRGGSMHPNDDA